MEQKSQQTPNQLTPVSYRWLDPDAAAQLSQWSGIERLRIGYGCLTPKLFAEALATGDLRIIVFSNECAALVTLGQTVEGNALNILTVQGDIDRCEAAMDSLETAARAIGVRLIVSVGHPGWARIMQRHGYDIQKRLLMRKVLHD